MGPVPFLWSPKSPILERLRAWVCFFALLNKSRYWPYCFDTITCASSILPPKWERLSIRVCYAPALKLFLALPTENRGYARVKLRKTADLSKSCIWATSPMQGRSRKASNAKRDWQAPTAYPLYLYYLILNDTPLLHLLRGKRVLHPPV